MKPASSFSEIMDELRCEHRALEAPKQLEMVLSAETQRKAGRPRSVVRPRAWAWGVSLVLLASVLWGAAAWRMHRVHSPSGKQADLMAHTMPAPHPQPETTASTAPAPMQQKERSVTGGQPTGNASTGHARVEHAATSMEKEASQPNFQESSMGDFVALPASEGLAPASAISLVRMQIQQNALQQYGFEVPADVEPRTLLAEFAVGEDGLPRAIRIIP